MKSLRIYITFYRLPISNKKFKIKTKYSNGDGNDIKKYIRNCVFVTVTVQEFIDQRAVVLLRRRLAIGDCANYAMKMQTMA